MDIISITQNEALDDSNLIKCPSAARHGFTAIAPNSYLAFSPNAKNTAYISVYTEGGRIVSTNFPVRENRSVIVNKDGYLREAVYGEIWKEK